MKACPKCNQLEGTPHERGCPMAKTRVEELEQALEVLMQIAILVGIEGELELYESDQARRLAIQSHVGDFVRRNAQLDKRNTELERRLLEVSRVLQGFRIDDEERKP